MSRIYELGQLLFALAAMVLVAERVRALGYRALTSERAMKWLAARLREGDRQGAVAWARRVPEAFVGRLILETLAPEDPERSPELVRVELRHVASLRLGVLRGFATLASALGLLGAILAIGQGFSGGGGLLALQAGLAQQVALARALERMALGVGTSAFCFFALGELRQMAKGLLAQTSHITHLLADLAAQERAPRGSSEHG